MGALLTSDTDSMHRIGVLESIRDLIVLPVGVDDIGAVATARSSATVKSIAKPALPSGMMLVSPFNLPRSTRLSMAIKAYFDGSGKTRDPQARFVTLAGYYGNEAQWLQFESDWNQILQKYDIPFVHMRELVPGNGPYVPRFKNNPNERSQLIRDCALVIRANNLSPVSCVAGLIENVTARRNLADFSLVKAELMCVDYCLAMMILGTAKDQILLYFDRDEGFAPELQRMYQNKKRRGKSFLKDINAPISVDMSQVPGVQAADILAWSLNRHQRDDRFDWILEKLDYLDRAKPNFESMDLLREGLQRLEQVMATR